MQNRRCCSRDQNGCSRDKNGCRTDKNGHGRDTNGHGYITNTAIFIINLVLGVVSCKLWQYKNGKLYMLKLKATDPLAWKHCLWEATVIIVKMIVPLQWRFGIGWCILSRDEIGGHGAWGHEGAELWSVLAKCNATEESATGQPPSSEQSIKLPQSLIFHLYVL